MPGGTYRIKTRKAPVRRRYIRRADKPKSRALISMYKAVPNVYKFKRRAGVVAVNIGSPPATVSFITCTGGTILYGSFGASMSTMSNVTEFSNLFDQYMIHEFKITLTTRYSGTSPGTVPSGTLYTVVDHNDLAPPTSINQLREFRYCKISYLNNKDKRTTTVKWKPQVNFSATDLAGVSVQPLVNPWVNFNTAGTNLTYPGLKYAVILDAPETDSLILDLEASFIFSCKNLQ